MRNLKLIFPILSLIFISSVRLDAQDYAKWFDVWDNYRGTWYGGKNTKVSLAREDGDEMFVTIVYKGTEYQDALWCVSSELATASYLSPTRGSTSTSITADISISNGSLILRNYLKIIQ